MSDGVSIRAAIFLPSGGGKFPTLFAASPYRFDNDHAPSIPMYLWRETGPVAWYLKQGYAFVHMDVRGSGRSGGTYKFLDKKEQHDLYEVIEWIAKQTWSNGKVGGIGQSYYAMTQWPRKTHRICLVWRLTMVWSICTDHRLFLVECQESSGTSGTKPSCAPFTSTRPKDRRENYPGIYRMRLANTRCMTHFGKNALQLRTSTKSSPRFIP